MKAFLLTLFFLFGWNYLQAQNVEWLTKSESISGSNQSIKAVVTDADNNTYALGSFSEQFNFDGQTYSVISPGGGGQTDLFIAKFSPQGEPLFFKRFGGNWYDTPYDIALDSNNNIYASVALQFPTLYFEDTTFQNSLAEACIVKFDSAGNFTQLINTSNSLLFSNGEIQIIGNSIYCISGVAFTKFTLNGEVQFIKTLPHLLSNVSLAKNDVGQLVFCGTGNTNYTFEGFSIAGQGSKFTIACVLDTTGNIIRHIDFGLNNTFDEQGNACEIDNEGNVYIGAFMPQGYYALFANDTIYDPLLNIPFQTLLKFDNLGVPEWAFNLIGTGETVNNILLDNAGNLAINGTYGSAYSAIGSIQLPSNGFNGNGYLARFTPDKQLLSAIGYGTSGSTDYSNDFTFDSNNNIIAGGSIGGGTNSIFGCINYASVLGGFCLFKLSNTPPPLPSVLSSFVQENNITFFSAQIAGATSYSWNYGDGTAPEVALNATHLFNQPGVFNACINASNSCGTSSSCHTILISGIQSVSPSNIANSGFYILDVKGAFPSQTGEMYLHLSGNNVMPDSSHFLNSGLYRMIFNLNQIPNGIYDLVYTHSDETDTLAAAVNVSDSQDILPEVVIISPSRVLVNRYFKHQIVVTNTSNKSIIAIPLIIDVSAPADLVLLDEIVSDSISQALLTDSLNNDHFATIAINEGSLDSIRAASFIIPFLNPGESTTMTILVKSNQLGSYKISASVNQSLFSENELGDLGLRSECSWSSVPACIQCLHDILGMVPVTGCAAGMVNLGCLIYKEINKRTTSSPDLGQVFNNRVTWGINLASTLLNCAGTTNLLKAGKALGLANAAIRTRFLRGVVTLNSANDVLGTASSCLPLPQPIGNPNNNCYSDVVNFAKNVFAAVSSLDPNTKSGPIGKNSLNCINGLDQVGYRIDFENVSSASASATEVLIVDTLDLSKFDLSTFRFTAFGFSDSLFLVDAEDTSFAREVDLRPVKNTILRVTGNLDQTNGILNYTFVSLDADTRTIQENIDDGFLNPNINGAEGGGFVSFHMHPIISLPDETVLSNRASITFDANPPIITPYYTNQIDRTPPTSAVLNPIEQINDSTMIIRWSGNDNASDVHFYHIAMTVNDTATYFIAVNFEGDSLLFTGEVGSTYKFYSIATDYVGNVEAEPINPDAAITLNAPLSQPHILPQSIVVHPNPFDDLVQLNSRSQTNSMFFISDVLGRIVYEGQFDNGSATLSLGHLNSGLYFVRFENNAHLTVKMVKQ